MPQTSGISPRTRGNEEELQYGAVASPARCAIGLFAVASVIGCTRTNAEPPAVPDASTAVQQWGDAFAIYETDDQNDITSRLSSTPPGFEIFHERDEAKTGYVYAALEGETPTAALGRLREWSAGLTIPAGDRIMFGRTTRTGVRTYLLKSAAIVDASGVAGAMASESGVALTFTPSAAAALTRALSETGHRFRIVVQGLVEQDRFELVDEQSNDALAGPHGALSTTDWVCSDHRAMLRMSTRAGTAAKTRAESLAALLPRFRSALECRAEPLFPRSR
jgi:hypothetical protein